MKGWPEAGKVEVSRRQIAISGDASGDDGWFLALPLARTRFQAMPE